MPVLGGYTYLGILFHFTTALWPAYVAKAQALTKRRNQMAQLISNKSMPVFTRQVGIKSMLVPVGMHGAEMLGCPITKDTTIPDDVLYTDGNSINKQAKGQQEIQAQLDTRCECYMPVPEENPESVQWPSTPSGRSSRSRRWQS